MPLEAVVEDLEKFTDYIIRIYAFTSNGNGIPSQAVAVRTQEDGKFYAKFQGYEPFFMNNCCHGFPKKNKKTKQNKKKHG